MPIYERARKHTLQRALKLRYVQRVLGAIPQSQNAANNSTPWMSQLPQCTRPHSEAHPAPRSAAVPAPSYLTTLRPPLPGPDIRLPLKHYYSRIPRKQASTKEHTRLKQRDPACCTAAAGASQWVPGNSMQPCRRPGACEGGEDPGTAFQ